MRWEREAAGTDYSREEVRCNYKRAGHWPEGRVCSWGLACTAAVSAIEEGIRRTAFPHSAQELDRYYPLPGLKAFLSA